MTAVVDLSRALAPLMILVLDHRDSFTWNLVHALARAGARVRVEQSDELSVGDVIALAPRGIVLSPGPGRPEQATLALTLVRRLGASVPMLGVCLGHQVICAAFGARVVRGAQPMHGRVSTIVHDQRGVFTGLPSPLRVARYHSLVVDASSLPTELIGTAYASDGALMGVRHLTWNVESVQFHPDSFLTEHGAELVAGWVSRLPRESPLGAAPATLGPHV